MIRAVLPVAARRRCHSSGTIRPGSETPLSMARLADRLGDRLVHVAVEHLGDQLGLDREPGQRPRGGALHLMLIALAPASRAAPEDPRVAEHVVDARAVGGERGAGRQARRRARSPAAGLVSARMTWPRADHLRRDQAGHAAGGDDHVGLAHHGVEVGDLDPARARLLLRPGLGSEASTRLTPASWISVGDPEARRAEADLADDRLIEPDVRPGGRPRSRPPWSRPRCRGRRRASPAGAAPRSAGARSRSTRASRCPRGGCRRSRARSGSTVSTNSSTSLVSIRIGTAVMSTSWA